MRTRDRPPRLCIMTTVTPPVFVGLEAPCRVDLPGLPSRNRSFSNSASRTSEVGIRGTWLDDCLNDLYRELRKKGVRIKPHAWISDEWFSPDNTPGIAIPFYLTHPRLMRLERKKIIDVEGGSAAECMRILRHEAGHVDAACLSAAAPAPLAATVRSFLNALSQALPAQSRAAERYVRHLRLWYAQSHPDEDFAETFAVWLTPRSNWRKRYAGWPALEEAAICRRADGGDRRAEAACSTGGWKSTRCGG